MALYLHDGSIGGHATWTEAALAASVADGAILSPFFTPESQLPRQPSGQQFADRVMAAGGEVIFDATTHAVSLPGVNRWSNYLTWSLWGGPVGDLSTPALVQEHVERVFDAQIGLRSPHLTPTLTLDSPIGPAADSALDVAEEGRSQNPQAWQTLSGRRGFWLSPDLDTYVGSLVALRAPTWFVTVVRDRLDYPPDMTDIAQTSAVARTIQSLAKRSRVVVCQSDLYGLPGVAAGADSIGTGWHTKQRICCPATYQENDPTVVRRSADWYTFEGLASRLNASVADILIRADRAKAEALHVGPLRSGGADLRHHHLEVVRNLTTTVDSVGGAARDRSVLLRKMYEDAVTDYDDLASRYGRLFYQARVSQVDGPRAGLEAYGSVEGFW